ncbi:MAG: hypothetical protein KJ063_24505 [Anaerolineae bacterium]|nr:hypothetical protein [Anaerolineae bacterium]
MSDELQNYFSQLHKLMDASFNIEEFRTLCLYLNVDYEHLRGDTKPAVITSLISYLANRNDLEALSGLLARERPNVKWPQLPTDLYSQRDPARSVETIGEHFLQQLEKDPVSIRRLPVPHHSYFRGREQEMYKLTQAWENPKARIVALVAMGGAGKSTLIFNWLNHFAETGYGNTERVFGWSFYSQGSSDRVASAGEFIEEALVFFGDPDPSRGTVAAKGERLATLVKAQRALLILDGLEPLQYPPGSTREGELKDRALLTFLQNLAFASKKCLCVITTRTSVTDLAGFGKPIVEEIDLESLNPTDGAKLLVDLGVNGSSSQLEKAVQEYEGHPLALSLLASYLSRFGGDIRRRDMIGPLEYAPKKGGHARRVMASYERWFIEDDNSQPLAILRMLGLFDRPAEMGVIKELREAAIPGLTDELTALSEWEWTEALDTLRRARLLPDIDYTYAAVLDTHPLVREHFGEELRKENISAWKLGNEHIYFYLTKQAKPNPRTLEELSPLYSAMYHGTRAERYSETLEEIYRHHILRGNEFFSTRTLGAVGEDLVALSNFFTKPYSQLVSPLSKEEQGFILRQTGYCLRAMGRLLDAADCMKVALKLQLEYGNPQEASIVAGLISHTYMTAGELRLMLTYGRQSLDLADEANDALHRAFKRTVLAYMLNQVGQIEEALVMYEEAMTIPPPIDEPEYPILRAFSYFHFCELLETKGQFDEMTQQADMGLRLLEQADGNRTLAEALLYLLSGRSYLGKAREGSMADLNRAEKQLQISMELLDKSGRDDCIILGLVARAEFYRLRQDWGKMQIDLMKAKMIAERGGMDLYQADALIGLAKYYMAQSENQKAENCWKEAKSLVEKMGYHSRDIDILAIQKSLTGLSATEATSQ